jgi:hypothetical protein
MEERKMTDRQYAAQKEPARKEAEEIVTLKRPEDCTVPNLGGEIAKAMLRQWGWYAFKWTRNGETKKVFLEVIA